MKNKFKVIIACVFVICAFAALSTACTEKQEVSLLANAATNDGSAAPGEIIVAAEGTNIVAKGFYTGAKNIIFENAGTSGNAVYTVFNTDKKAIVYSGESEPYVLEFTDGEVWEDMFICVDEKLSGRYVTFYTPDGALAADVYDDDLLSYDSYSEKFMINASAIADGGINLGDDSIIVKDGSDYYLVSVSDNAFGLYIPDELVETENYKIWFYPDQSAFVVLEKGKYTGGKTVSISSVTGSVTSSNRQNVIIILPDDKIAVQEIIMLPANTTKGYDFYIGEVMYSLNTYIYDIANGKTKKTGDSGYVITGSEYDKDGGFTACMCMRILGDRSLSSAGLQIFGSDMKVAVDVQSILPGATSYEAGGGYVVFRNSERIVIYKGDERVLDAPLSKLNADYSLITVSGVMLSADGTTVYDADGSKLLSLDDVGGYGFILENYWQNYVYYYTLNSYGDGYVYAYDRSSGETEYFCRLSSFEELCPGFVCVKETGKYNLYDAVTKSVLKDFLVEPTYFGEADGGYLLNYSGFAYGSTVDFGIVKGYAYLTR